MRNAFVAVGRKPLALRNILEKPGQHTLPRSVGWGRLRAGSSWGPREVWPRSEIPRTCFGGRRVGESLPLTKLQGPSSGIKSGITSSHSERQEAGSPPTHPPESTPPPSPAASIKWGQLWNAASPRDLRRGEVGGAPRPPPSPGAPSPPPRCSMLSPGPPPALHRRAAWLQPARPTRSGPARPGPAPPPQRPRPGPARPGPAPARLEWAAQRWGGSGGDPAPGARTRAGTPRHACPAGNTQELRGGTQAPSFRGPVSGVSVGSGLGGGGGRSPSTPTRAPGPAAAGHCSSTKGQAPRRPPFPLLLSRRCLFPQTHSPASESRGGGGGSVAPDSGPCAPAQVGGQGLVGVCPTRSRLEEARLDLWRWRHLAAHSENTLGHRQPWGTLP